MRYRLANTPGATHFFMLNVADRAGACWRATSTPCETAFARYGVRA